MNFYFDQYWQKLLLSFTVKTFMTILFTSKTFGSVWRNSKFWWSIVKITTVVTTFRFQFIFSYIIRINILENFLTQIIDVSILPLTARNGFWLCFIKADLDFPSQYIFSSLNPSKVLTPYKIILFAESSLITSII